MRRAATAVAAACLLAGCGAGGAADETTVTTGTATGETAGPALARSCTNREDGFTVGFPAGWHTNEGDGVPACTFFHPEPFALPEAGEALDVAIRVDVEPVPFDRVTGPSPAREITSRRDVEVAGRPGVRIEFVSTGEALLPEGVRGTEYLVDLDGSTLVASTLDIGGLDYERNAQVLDAMMESLTLG